MTDRSKVAAYYDQSVQREWGRLTQSPLHEAEWELTLDLIHTYIAPGAGVLDVGAGPGRYAEYLIRQQGCAVGLVDLSCEALKAFTERIPPDCDNHVLFTRTTCATDLSGIGDAQFDAVLELGPLYHLREPHERQQALAECLRVLKPGGVALVAFLSPYPLLPRILDRAPELLDQPELLHQLTSGQSVPAAGNLSGLVEQYRCWPHQAQALMEAAGFETLHLRNLEGVGTTCSMELQAAALADPARREAWFGLLRQTCENPGLLGATIHFLYTGRKPAK